MSRVYERLPDDAAGPLCDGTRIGRWLNAEAGRRDEVPSSQSGSARCIDAPRQCAYSGCAAASRRRDQGRIAMADDEEVLDETIAPDPGGEDEYVFIEADQPVWQVLGER